MDFGTLLHMAKKNSQDSRNDGKYYSTKFAPPKKESKEKKLSENIQKFLQKKEQEEKMKQQDQQQKLNQLLSMRDEKSKNKIRKMLKVTKSANRSVLEDAVNTEHTAVTMQGPEQPDQDDYGYVSTEANSFYQKYIDKVKDVKEDKGFAPSRPQSLKDLRGTKERVKAAITREIEEKHSHTRNRVSQVKDSPSSASNLSVARTSAKPIYDPEEEKRREEEERKKVDAEKKKTKNRKPPPPLMDFQALLKLAEKKQHEPIDVPVEVKKKKEPERLMTMKEKQEMEERQRAKEARERRDRERNDEYAKGKRQDKERGSSYNSSTIPRMEPNGRIPKVAHLNTASNNGNSRKTTLPSEKKPSSLLDKKTSTSSSVNFVKPSTSSLSSSSNKISASHLSHSSSAKSSSKLGVSSSSSNKPSLSSGTSNNAPSSKNAYSKSCPGKPYNGPTREFPPRDISAVKSREFPPRDLQNTRQFPPPDVRRGMGSSLCKYGDSKKSTTSKRRILDEDDDSEYDSELDDFIDDGEEEEDYSSHIKAIFGYDKSKYRDEDFDDRGMESNFAQVQREEYISKKIGIKEDLEDMKQEAMEKKRKMMMKKRRLS